ncbi:hypothetical protein [Schaalia vaccimaxillae]|uniref:hypothetical protein n=1 Tax=Schaalia vaccimaxillae TaxID=183916 RepID=UPI001039C1CA|nr:hypothetical protein [Schaalia vaccimaxillae]
MLHSLSSKQQARVELSRGLYGHSGWLQDTGVCDLIAPYMTGTRTIDYCRFSDLTGEDIHTLVDILPKEALLDRQNNAPTLGQMLTVAQGSIPVFLSGYIITAPRWDERITVDSIMLVSPDPYCDDRSEGDRQDWCRVLEELDLPRDTMMPDEFLRLPYSPSSGSAWWMWWD